MIFIFNVTTVISVYKRTRIRWDHSFHFIYYKFVTCHNFESKTSRHISFMCTSIKFYLEFIFILCTERILSQLFFLESWLNKINIRTLHIMCYAACWSYPILIRITFIIKLELLKEWTKFRVYIPFTCIMGNQFDKDNIKRYTILKYYHLPYIYS